MTGNRTIRSHIRARSHLVAGVLVLLGVLGFGWLAMGPHLAEWNQVYLGADDVDTWGTQWFYWLIGRWTQGDVSFAHTDLLYFPWGKDVYLHTGGNVLDAFAALPLRFVFGPKVGYNLFCAAILLANGLGAAVLARACRAGPLVAGLVGVSFAFNPYALGEIGGGRPTQAILVFLCLFFAAWLRLGETPRPGVAIIAGALLGLCGLTYWYYALFAVLVVLPHGLLRLLSAPSAPRGWLVLLGMEALAAGVALAMALPLALPMLLAAGLDDVPGLLAVNRWTLHSWAPLTREGWSIGVQLLDPLTLRSGVAMEGSAGLQLVPGALVVGWAQVGMAALGLARGRGRAMLVGLLLVGLAIATGPALSATGPVNPAYLGLVHVAAVMRRLWWPVRAVALVQVALAGLAALGLMRLASHPRLQAALALGWLCLGALELEQAGVLPIPVASAEVPALYECLAAAEAGALIELPDSGNPRRLHYQAVHHKARFGGMMEDNPIFTPAAHLAWMEDNAWIAALLQATDPGGGLVRVDPDDPAMVEGRQEAGEMGFRYVVVDVGTSVATGKEGERQRRQARGLLRRLLGSPAVDTGALMVFLPWGGSFSCPPPAPAPSTAR